MFYKYDEIHNLNSNPLHFLYFWNSGTKETPRLLINMGGSMTFKISETEHTILSSFSGQIQFWSDIFMVSIIPFNWVGQRFICIACYNFIHQYIKFHLKFGMILLPLIVLNTTWSSHRRHHVPVTLHRSTICLMKS